MMKKWLLIFCTTGFLSANAQENDLGNWLIYFGNKKINNSWSWHHEVQHRNYNVIGDLEQLLLRTGIGYNINKSNNLLLGYGFIDSRNHINNSDEILKIKEHRIYQQFISLHTIGKIRVQHRYRFEQRFVENDFKVRYRYFLNLKAPILKNSDQYYVSVYNELFINSKGDNIFDRNRLYGGIGYVLNSNMKVELGYMNQFFKTSERDQINFICFYNF